jgi:hydroxyquinol 1,2-dioxygenase
MRPAHIHFHIVAAGIISLTTHIFQKDCQCIDTDVVFGVKEPLIVEFVKKSSGSKAPNGELMNESFYEVK